MVTNNKCIVNRRVSRHKKKHWRKGTRLEDVEDFLHQAIECDREKSLCKRKNEDLFFIDRTGGDETMKNRLTRRQRVAIAKEKLINRFVDGSCAANFESENPKSCGTQKRIHNRRRKSKSCAGTGNKTRFYDMWFDDSKGQKEVSQGDEHYLRTTKKLLPKLPSELHNLSSHLPPVEIAPTSSSYNPAADTYMNAIDSYATDELQRERHKLKLDKWLKSTATEDFVSQKDRVAELRIGLFDDDDVNDAKEVDSDTKSEINEKRRKVQCKRRTSAAKRREAQQNRTKILKGKVKATNKQLNAILSVKRLNKEITERVDEQMKCAEIRKKWKITKSLYKTKKLGRGKFQQMDEPFLLPEELPFSLRELHPQSDIISLRLESMQKRNMLPVPANNFKIKGLKRRLKIKHIERRSHKEVTIGSKAM